MEIDISLSQLKKTYNSYFNSTEQEYQASKSKSKSKSKSVDLHKDEPSYIKLTPNILSNLNEMDEMDGMANETGEEGRNPNDQTTLLPTQTNRNDSNAKNVSCDKSSQQSLMTNVNKNNNNPMNEMEETDNESDDNNNNDNNNEIKDDNNCIENKHEDDCKNENDKENKKGVNKEEEEEDVMEMNDMAPSWAFDTLEEEIEYLRNVNLRLRYELEVSNANTNQSSSLASAFTGVGGRGCDGSGGDNDDDSKLELKIQNNDLTHKLNKDKKVSFAMNKAFLNNAKVSPYEFSQRVQSKLPQFLRKEENNGKFVSNIDDTTNKDTIYIPSMIENEIGIIDIKHVDWWDIIDYDSIDCDDDYLKSNLNNTIDGQNTSDQMVFNNGVALDGPFVLVRESDVVDAVACFVAQCVIKMPECRNLSHDQMLKLLDGTFAELREKGPIGKLIQWGQMGYSAYGYGKYAWTLYTNPLVAEVVMAAFAQAVIFFGVL